MHGHYLERNHGRRICLTNKGKDKSLKNRLKSLMLFQDHVDSHSDGRAQDGHVGLVILDGYDAMPEVTAYRVRTVRRIQ